MRVIAVSTLRQFWERHPDAEQPLKAWFDEASKATWAQPSDIKVQYRNASVLKNRRVVFNIKGNDYRLIVAIAYKLGIVYVKFIGTHAEYDKIDLELALLSKNKEKIEKSSGATVVISEEAVINIASDKYLTYKFFEQHKILAPKTYISVADTIEALSTGEISFPLMIKPRWGSASISLLKINTLEELRPAYLACSEAIKNSILNSLGDSDSVIIQEFIEGQEYGLDILNSLDSEHIGFCAKKKLAMRAGETDKATPIDGRRFEDSAKKISKHLRHIGNLDCDVLEKNGALYYLELNPRFGGGYPFTHLAGANHIELLLSTDDNTLKSEKYSYTTDYTLSKCDTIVKFKIK